MKWFDYVRYVDDDQLQDHWAELLTGALEGRFDDQRIVWAMNQLAKLAPQDAIVLSAMCGARRTLWVDGRADISEPGWRLARACQFLRGEGIIEYGNRMFDGIITSYQNRMASPRPGSSHYGMFAVEIEHGYVAGKGQGLQIGGLRLAPNTSDFTDIVGAKPLLDYGEYEPFLVRDEEALPRMMALRDEFAVGSGS